MDVEADATGRDRVYGWLSVGYHVSGGLEAGSGWSLRPPTAIYRLYLEAHFTYNWGVGFCPLDRAVGVNPGFSLRYGMRLVVLVPQHQTAMYETHN
jgi:hypothetical protein